jgi:hypothetical protein
MSREKATPSQKGQNLLSFYRAGKEIPPDDYREADIRNSNCPKLEMIYHDLTRINAQKSILNEARFIQCNLQQANFQYCQLQQATLSFSLLEGIRLGGCRAPDISFQQSSLRTAKLQQSILWRANLQLSSLAYADCSGADLRWADLRGCNLRNCNFQGTSLIGAIINQQTVEKSQWTEKEKDNFLSKGTIWKPVSVQHSVFSEGIQINTVENIPKESQWALETLATLCECAVSIIGKDNNLFLSLKNGISLYRLGQELGILTIQPEKSILNNHIHDQQIVTLHHWLNTGATINLWESVEGEISHTETWTSEDAVELEE